MKIVAAIAACAIAASAGSATAAVYMDQISGATFASGALSNYGGGNTSFSDDFEVDGFGPGTFDLTQLQAAVRVPGAPGVQPAGYSVDVFSSLAALMTNTGRGDLYHEEFGQVAKNTVTPEMLA